MKYILLTASLLLTLSFTAAAQSRVTRADAAAALRGECLKTGDVGYHLALDRDLGPQLLLFTGGVREQRIIPVGELRSAPAGWLDTGSLVDVDLREYRLVAEPLPPIKLCQGAPVRQVLGVKVARGHSTRDQWIRALLSPLGVLRVFGLNSRAEYDQ